MAHLCDDVLATGVGAFQPGGVFLDDVDAYGSEGDDVGEETGGESDENILVCDHTCNDYMKAQFDTAFAPSWFAPHRCKADMVAQPGTPGADRASVPAIQGQIPSWYCLGKYNLLPEGCHLAVEP